jgi:septum formation protein
MEFLKINKPIILASASPRRRELIKKLLYNSPFLKFITPKVNENIPEDIELYNSAAFLSEYKLKQILPTQKGLVITADTVVMAKNKILGKPITPEQAYEYLKLLSGNTHYVISAFSLGDENGIIKTISDKTEVKFKTLNDKEIKWYIDNYKPFDKAGAYGIQEWIGIMGIEKIKGSFYTVMGLPTHLLFEELKNYFTKNIQL